MNSGSCRSSIVIVLFHLCPAPPPPLPTHPRGTAEHLPRLVSPGVGHLQILHCPGGGGRAFANPGAIPELLTRGFLSEYNYTEGFTGKKSRLAHLSRTGID